MSLHTNGIKASNKHAANETRITVGQNICVAFIVIRFLACSQQETEMEIPLCLAEIKRAAEIV